MGAYFVVSCLSATFLNISNIFVSVNTFLEDLGMLLGQCLEAKIRGKRILDILKDLR